MEDLKHSVALQLSVHQAEVEGLLAAHQLEVKRLCRAHLTELELKDSFCEAKKVHVLAELQASYTSKLLGLYDEQYELGY